MLSKVSRRKILFIDISINSIYRTDGHRAIGRTWHSSLWRNFSPVEAISFRKLRGVTSHHSLGRAVFPGDTVRGSNRECSRCATPASPGRLYPGRGAAILTLAHCNEDVKNSKKYALFFSFFSHLFISKPDARCRICRLVEQSAVKRTQPGRPG